MADSDPDTLIAHAIAWRVSAVHPALRPWQFWSRFTALYGTHPEMGSGGSEAIWISNSADSDLKPSHELVLTAAAVSTLRNRKVRAGDNELTYIPWRAIKDKSNWKFSWPSPPKAAAVAPAASP